MIEGQGKFLIICAALIFGTLGSAVYITIQDQKKLDIVLADLDAQGVTYKLGYTTTGPSHTRSICYHLGNGGTIASDGSDFSSRESCRLNTND